MRKFFRKVLVDVPLFVFTVAFGIVVPLQMCVCVKIYLSNGQVIKFTALKITSKKGINNKLAQIDVVGGNGFPMYTNLDKVVSVQATRGVRPRLGAFFG